MTSIREQFEAAVEAKFKNVDFSLCTAEEGFILCVGEYKQPAVQTMWWAWQSSRSFEEDAVKDSYTCIGKGGRYEILGLATGAGLSRGEDRLVYRDASTGRLFLRTEQDFSERMERITKC